MSRHNLKQALIAVLDFYPSNVLCGTIHRSDLKDYLILATNHTTEDWERFLAIIDEEHFSMIARLWLMDRSWITLENDRETGIDYWHHHIPIPRPIECFGKTKLELNKR